MRVLLLCEDFPPRSGGGGVHAYNIALKLSERGHDVSVLSSGYTPVPNAPFPVEKVGRSRLGYLMGALRHDMTGYDVVHAHGWLPALVAVLKRVRPRMWTPHGWHLGTVNATERNPFARLLKGALGRFVARADFDAWIVICEESRQALLKQGMSESKITKISNGVDVQRFSRIERNASDIKTFLFAGRLDMEVKGIDVLLEAGKALKHRDDIRVLIVGEGKDERRIEEKVARHGLSNVHLNQYQEDIGEHYASAYALVLPSRTEGFPLVLLEAMAVGLPVIATRVGEVASVIEDGDGGLLVRSGSAAALGGAIERLADDPRMASRMGEFNRKRASSYDWEVVSSKIEAQYNQAQGVGPVDKST
jgi:glycosyltransferase involved in cell wall biosynthesis